MMEIFALLSLLLQFLMGFLPFIIFAVFIVSIKKIFQNPQKKPGQAPPTKTNIAPRNNLEVQNKSQTKKGPRNTWAQQARNMSELLKEELLQPEPTKVSQTQRTSSPFTQKAKQSSQVSSPGRTAATQLREKQTPLAPVMVPNNQVIDPEHLVQAMIYKEILDKPLALRD